MELEEVKPKNKIQEYTEKRKTEQIAREQGDLEQKEKVKQKREESKQKAKTAISSIPHVAKLAVGVGAGSLIASLIKDIKDGKFKWLLK